MLILHGPALGQRQGDATGTSAAQQLETTEGTICSVLGTPKPASRAGTGSDSHPGMVLIPRWESVSDSLLHLWEKAGNLDSELPNCTQHERSPPALKELHSARKGHTSDLPPKSWVSSCQGHAKMLQETSTTPDFSVIPYSIIAMIPAMS